MQDQIRLAQEIYGACYDACQRNAEGPWSVCLWTDGTIGITTCPSAHANLDKVLMQNVDIADFGDWDIEHTIREEFIEGCIAGYGVEICGSCLAL